MNNEKKSIKCFQMALMSCGVSVGFVVAAIAWIIERFLPFSISVPFCYSVAAAISLVTGAINMTKSYRLWRGPYTIDPRRTDI